MITDEQFKQIGYTQIHQRDMFHLNADRFFQRIVKDSEGNKLYFINLFGYKGLKSIEAQVYFYQEDDDAPVIVTKVLRDPSIDPAIDSIRRMEWFFSEMYDLMHFIPDINNN